MNENLPYYTLLNHLVQQTIIGTTLLKSIDQLLGEQHQANTKLILKQLKQLNNRMDLLMEYMAKAGLLQKEWLDNTDLKLMFSVKDTKIYNLKKSGYLKSYDLDGKEVYKHEEVTEAVLGHPAGGAEREKRKA